LLHTEYKILTTELNSRLKKNIY